MFKSVRCYVNLIKEIHKYRCNQGATSSPTRACTHALPLTSNREHYRLPINPFCLSSFAEHLLKNTMGLWGLFLSFYTVSLCVWASLFLLGGFHSHKLLLFHWEAELVNIYIFPTTVSYQLSPKHYFYPLGGRVQGNWRRGGQTGRLRQTHR